MEEVNMEGKFYTLIENGSKLGNKIDKKLKNDQNLNSIKDKFKRYVLNNPSTLYSYYSIKYFYDFMAHVLRNKEEGNQIHIIVQTTDRHSYNEYLIISILLFEFLPYQAIDNLNGVNI